MTTTLISPIKPEKTNGDYAVSTKLASQHNKAVKHHEEAAKLNLEAMKHHEAGNFAKSCECAEKAHGHYIIAAEAHKEVLKHHANAK